MHVPAADTAIRAVQSFDQGSLWDSFWKDKTWPIECFGLDSVSVFKFTDLGLVTNIN